MALCIYELLVLEKESPVWVRGRTAFKERFLFLLKKSYVRTRLSVIPECGWQWDVLNPFDESHPLDSGHSCY